MKGQYEFETESEISVFFDGVTVARTDDYDAVKQGIYIYSTSRMVSGQFGRIIES